MFRSYSGSKWGCRKKSVVLRKIKRCCKSKSLCQFWSNRLETNRTWSPNIRVHVLFVSKRSDQNWRSDFDLQRLIYDATNVETGADFGLKDRLPPFAIHIMNPLDMRFTRYHLLYTFSKNWANCDWVIVFLGYFGDFWGWEPRLYSEISLFQNLSVLGDFYALYHFVCHTYNI